MNKLANLMNKLANLMNKLAFPLVSFSVRQVENNFSFLVRNAAYRNLLKTKVLG